MSMLDSATPDARSTKGRVPVFRPLLNGEEFPVTLTSATVQLSEGQHDVAMLACTSTVLTKTDGMVDSLLSFFYGQAPRTELFCGYVVVAEVTQAGQGMLTFTLVVLGPTKVMQEGQPRFWSRKTATSAVQALVANALLGYTGHDDTHLWRTLSQTDESDWTACLQAAHRLGWAVFNRYGVVMCYDPQTLIRENGSYATLVSSQDQDFDAAADRRLIEFTPQEISDDTPKAMGQRVAYLDTDGQVLVAKQAGSFKRYRFLTNFVIDSHEDAQVYVNAADSLLDNWKQTATARIWGDSDIYPGMCVTVHTTNTAYIRNKFDGRWLVRSVQHTMDTSQFQTMLTLARPASATPVAQAPYTSFWNTRARPSLSIQDGGTISGNDSTAVTAKPSQVWVSSWADLRIRDSL